MVEDSISQSLDGYLSQSRLSMNQIARKWGVSAPLLSQIKNGKKRPSLELGLKILREAGASVEERKRWLENRENSGVELSRIYEDEKKQRVEYSLQKSFCDLLESNPMLLDIFLDISLMAAKGLSWNGLFKNYGEYGLELVHVLIESGLVRKEEERYYIVQSELPHAVDLQNSLGIMKTVFEGLKQNAKKDNFRGEFHFDLTDISPEGYQKLKTLNREYTQKMVSIIKENEMPRIKGGIRIVSQNIVSVMKTVILIFFISILPESPLAQGNGLTGGGSGKIIDGIDTNIEELKRAGRPSLPPIRFPRDIIERRGAESIKVGYWAAAFKTNYYRDQKDAVESMVQINKILEQGEFSRDAAEKLFRQLPTDCHSHRMNFSQRRIIISSLTKKGTIKPLGFKIEPSYMPDGTPRYQAKGEFLLPCKVED